MGCCGICNWCMCHECNIDQETVVDDLRGTWNINVSAASASALYSFKYVDGPIVGSSKVTTLEGRVISRGQIRFVERWTANNEVAGVSEAIVDGCTMTGSTRLTTGNITKWTAQR